MPPIPKESLERPANRYLVLRGDQVLGDALRALQDEGGQEWWFLIVDLGDGCYLAARFSDFRERIVNERPDIFRDRLDALGEPLSPVEAVEEATDLSDAQAAALRSQLKLVVVIRDGAVVGLLNLGDSRGVQFFGETSIFGLAGLVEAELGDSSQPRPAGRARADSLREEAELSESLAPKPSEDKTAGPEPPVPLPPSAPEPLPQPDADEPMPGRLQAAQAEPVEKGVDEIPKPAIAVAPSAQPPAPPVPPPPARTESAETVPPASINVEIGQNVESGGQVIVAGRDVIVGAQPAEKAQAQMRRFEAALPQETQVGVEHKLQIAVMMPDAPSPFGDTDRPQATERTDDVPIALPVDRETGELKPVEIEVAVTAASFRIKGDAKKMLTVWPDGRTAIRWFLLEPEETGKQDVQIELSCQGRLLAEISVHTVVYAPEAKARPLLNLSLSIVSFRLNVSFAAGAA